MTQSSANPNTQKPTLTLLGKKPIALAAFKQPIKLVEPVAAAEHGPSLFTSSDCTMLMPNCETLTARTPDAGAGQNSLARSSGSDRELDPDVARSLDNVAKRVPDRLRDEHGPSLADGKIETDISKPKKPRDIPQPFVHIEGSPVQPPEGLAFTADPRAVSAAVSTWLRRIAREVGAAVPWDQREAAEAFVKSHRLSVACAFQRRLAKADVVKAMMEIFVVHKEMYPPGK
jgi:hypothetical protein